MRGGGAREDTEKYKRKKKYCVKIIISFFQSANLRFKIYELFTTISKRKIDFNVQFSKPHIGKYNLAEKYCPSE